MATLKTISYAKSILEDLYVGDDDKLQFDYKGKGGLKVTMGKGSVSFEPFSSKSKDFGGSEVITLFNTGNIKGSDRETIVTPILKALKGKSSAEVNKDDFKKWLSQAARVMGKYINKTYSPDAVLSIRSSSALNNQFIKELSQHLDASIIIPDAISKVSLGDIKIDKKATDKQRKALENILKKAKGQGFIEFKKIHTSLRPLLKGVMKLENIGYGIEGKKILIIDDYISSRASMIHAFDAVRQFAPREIVGATLFKA